MDQGADSLKAASPATTATSSSFDSRTPNKSNGPEQSLRAALRYIQDVEALFANRPNDFQRVLTNIRFWASGDFTAEEVRWRTGQLFGRQNSDLFGTFMLFRPEDQEKHVKPVVNVRGKRTAKSKARPAKLLTPESDEGEAQKKPMFQEVVLLLQEAKARLQDQRDKRVALRKVLKLCAASEDDDEMVVESLECLLEDHRDLADRFLDLVNRTKEDG